MATRFAPFGEYTSAQAIPGATKTELTANLNSFKALIPGAGAGFDGMAPASPDFGHIPPACGEKIRAEIDALIAAVAAAA